MFNFDDDKFEFEDMFKGHSHEAHWESSNAAMDIVIGLACVVGVALLLALLCRCCRSTKYRGRVLQPAPDPNSSVPVPPGPGVAPYPQQQYSTVTVAVPAVSAMGAHGAGAPYVMSAAPYPAGGAPYPAAGAPYPAGGAPYPVGAPYPAGGAAYPAGPYPGAMPQPNAAPSAPDAHTLPPSYDQVMSNEAKHPPYNPYAPH